VPANFRLLVLINLVIPFQSTVAGDAALRSVLGNELTPPGMPLLLEQWPTLLLALLLVVLLVRFPALRTPEILTVALFAVAFVIAGAVAIRRFMELGGPLCLLALALVAREWRAAELPAAIARAARPAAAIGLVVAALAVLAALQRYDEGRWSPPRQMAEWLGEHGHRGERVFTVQWADSAPLFYSAPQLQSLVAMDPTLFYAEDPALFRTYVDIVQRRDPDPLRAIRERFHARWVTVWKAYPRVGMMLQNAGAPVAYSDSDYVIFDLGGST